MRSLDNKNKKTFLVFGIVAILILLTFSILIFQYIKSKPQVYNIEKNTIVYDKTQNMIDVSSEAKLTKKWDNDYVLQIAKKNHFMGSKVVLYNPQSNKLDVHGGGYEVLDNGDVLPLSKYTTLAKLSDVKFFKIDDRRYLVTGSNINVTNESFKTSKYLEIILDKAGNAQLINNELNFKTLNPIIVEIDGTFKFDVANEFVEINGQKVDLKRIGGSTNLYKGSSTFDTNASLNNNTSNNEMNNGNNNSGGSGSGGSGSGGSGSGGSGSGGSGSGGSGSGGSGSGGSGTSNNKGLQGFINNVFDKLNSSNNNQLNNNSGSSAPSDNIAKSRMQLNVVDGLLTGLRVNYYVLDPQSRYASVFVDIFDLQENLISRNYVSKEESYKEIYNLSPNTSYIVKMGYTSTKTAPSGASQQVEEIVDVRKTSTLSPTSSITVSKILTDQIVVNVKIDKSLVIDSGVVSMYNAKGDKKISSQNIDQVVARTDAGYDISFKIPKANLADNSFLFKFEEVKFAQKEIKLNSIAIAKR